MMYANNLPVISASVVDLQLLLDICGSERRYMGIKISKDVVNIGPVCHLPLADLCINSMSLDWTANYYHI